MQFEMDDAWDKLKHDVEWANFKMHYNIMDLEDPTVARKGCQIKGNFVKDVYIRELCGGPSDYRSIELRKFSAFFLQSEIYL